MGDFDRALELRLAQLSAQLDEARRSADLTSRENDSLKIEMIRVRRSEEIANGLKDENAAMKEDLAEAKRMEEDAHIRERDLISQNSTLKGKLDRSRQREKAVADMRDNTLVINAELKAELTEWNSKETDWNNKKDALTRENATLEGIVAAAKRNEEIAKSLNFELAAKNFTLKGELEDMRKREEIANGLRNDLESKNSSLKKKLDEKTRKTAHLICEIGDPLNIFQLHCPCSPDAISLGDARRELPSYHPTPDWTFYSRCHPDWNTSFVCELCEETFTNEEVLYHFDSFEHRENVESRGGFVSKEAVKYWESVIEEVLEWQDRDRDFYDDNGNFRYW